MVFTRLVNRDSAARDEWRFFIYSGISPITSFF